MRAGLDLQAARHPRTKTVFKITYAYLCLLNRIHFWGCVIVLFLATNIISSQVSDRKGFAQSELYQGVMDRWGAPIDQPAPSVRYVKSGSVFTTLIPLPLERQDIRIQAIMNYRKRGLVYFSGFDFSFSGRFTVTNPKPYDIDIAFVFPVSLNKNKVLLSDLSFLVDGEPSKSELSEDGKSFIWTGRLENDQVVQFEVSFSGRGLDNFVYRMDPDLPVRNFNLTMNVKGGENYDYPPGVIPAHHTSTNKDTIALGWNYPSLESGVPTGAILPSEQSFDTIIVTMTNRAWAPFIIFLVSLVVLSLVSGRSFRIHESYLLTCGFAFFFVLLAYLAAFMNFYVAYAISSVLVLSLLIYYCYQLLGHLGAMYIATMLSVLLIIPSFAVTLQGYTGLIYTIEIFVGLAAIMVFSSQKKYEPLLSAITQGREK
ncbi:MAG: hypothetical protein KTR25_14030 [Myxococcales bacterium]|nr:hypothetical protein [Myxococcales bacterium]